MSKTYPHTPPPKDYGHGGTGAAVSNTVYPDNFGGGNAPAESVATSQKLSEAEAAAAMREFDKGK